MEQVFSYVPSWGGGNDGSRGSAQNGGAFRHRGSQEAEPLRIWNQMPRKLVVPSHFGRRQTSELWQAGTQLCRDVVMSIAKELTPLLLEDTIWLPEVFPDVIVNLPLPQHLWSASIHMSSSTSRTVTGAQCTWFISFGPLDCAGRAFQPRTLRWELVQGGVPVPGCSVVSRRRAPQERALAPFAPDGLMGGWA